MNTSVWSTVWPDWQLKNVIGRGAYGVVYRAVRFIGEKQEESAIKVVSLPQDELDVEQLKAEGLTNEEMQSYYATMANEFYEEIQTMKSLNGSASIVNVQDSAILPLNDRIGWNILIRMECLTPLTEYLDGRTLSEDEIISLGTDLCCALEVCEAKGILHRDIKPENIFVDKEGHYKLGDFGIAKQLEATTGAMTRVGTPFYSAPEVAEGKRYDKRADIYCLGLVLYRLANGGRLPFLPEKRLLTPNDRRAALERRLSGETPPAPSGVSESLARVILKACDPKAKNRYENASAFREALEDARRPAIIPWWKKRGGIAAGIVLAFLLAGGLSFMFSPKLSKAAYAICSRIMLTVKNLFPGGPSPIPDTESAEPLPPESTEPSSPESTEPSSPESTKTEVAFASGDKAENLSEDATEDISEAVTEDASPTEKHSPESGTDTPPETNGPVPSGSSSAEAYTLPKETAQGIATEAAKETRKETEKETVKEPPKESVKETAAATAEATTAHTHSYSAWTVTKAATCTDPGERSRRCSCGDVQTEVLAAAGHSYGSWITVSEATCTASGTRQRSCSLCGASETETLSALGHNMSGGVCTRCGESVFGFVINADNASYTLASSTQSSFSEKVTLPSSYNGLPVTRIKDGLFKGAYFGGGLVLPSRLNYIGQNTFANTTIAGTLTIPGTVKTIAEWAFNRANLGNVIIEEGVVTLKSVSFGSLEGSPSMTLPSTIQGHDNPFSMSSTSSLTRFSTLTINSQNLLDSLLVNGQTGLGSFTAGTIKLGAGISGYAVKGNCLIRTSSGTLLKAGTSFTIPTDGSVRIIDGCPFFTDFNGNYPSSLYTITFPEGVEQIIDAAYSSSITTIYLPHSLKYFAPGSFRGGGLKNIIYSGTKEEWIAATDSSKQYSSALHVGCTDGTLHYENGHWTEE